MKKRVHISWLIAWASFGILLGILLALKTESYFSEPSWLIFGLALLIAAIINRRKYIFIVVIVAGLSIGLWRGSSEHVERTGYQNYFGQSVNLSGEVSEDTAFSQNGQQRIKLKNIIVDDNKLPGIVWVSSSNQIEIKRSDNLVIEGRLQAGFGNFPATVYHAEITQIVRTPHKDIGLEVRDWFSSGAKKVLDEPEVALGLGFLTGQHTSLPEDFNNNLRLLGLTHIVVASGYNLTILVRLTRRKLAKISKYMATLSAVLLMSGFILVTGFSPSMTRAALITSLSLAAWYYGRRIHPLILLPFAAAITVLFNPAYLWGDLGWYLSFAAFGGVIVLSPLLLHYFWGPDYKPNQVHQIFLETLSAQIATAPLIAFIFGSFAPLSIPANILILLFIPLAMILTFIAGLAGALSIPLAALLAFPAFAILRYMVFVVDKLAALPIAAGEINFNLQSLIISYIAILVLIVWLARRTKHNFLTSSIVD